MNVIDNFESELHTHINLLNRAFENKNYNEIVEESEKITKSAYFLYMLGNNKDALKESENKSEVL